MELERLIHRLSTDSSFMAEFRRDPKRVLEKEGCNPGDPEVAALLSTLGRSPVSMAGPMLDWYGPVKGADRVPQLDWYGPVKAAGRVPQLDWYGPVKAADRIPQLDWYGPVKAADRIPQLDWYGPTKTASRIPQLDWYAPEKQPQEV